VHWWILKPRTLGRFVKFVTIRPTTLRRLSRFVGIKKWKKSCYRYEKLINWENIKNKKRGSWELNPRPRGHLIPHKPLPWSYKFSYQILWS
jgi:hypothetical protein